MEESIDDSVNVNYLLFEGLLLQIHRLRGTVKNSVFVFYGFDAHKSFLCLTKQIDRTMINKNEINIFTVIP